MPAVHLLLFIQSRIAVELEPFPAVIGQEAGYTMERKQICFFVVKISDFWIFFFILLLHTLLLCEQVFNWNKSTCVLHLYWSHYICISVHLVWFVEVSKEFHMEFSCFLWFDLLYLLFLGLCIFFSFTHCHAELHTSASHMVCFVICIIYNWTDSSQVPASLFW